MAYGKNILLRWGRSGYSGARRQSPFFALVILLVGGVAVMLATTRSAQAVECPNEILRIAQSSTQLPGCRAYELVSPPDGTPYLEAVSNDPIAARASSTGGGIAWFSYNPLSSSPGGGFYNLSTRSTSGWASQSLSPRLSTSSGQYFACAPEMFFSADLTKAVLSDGLRSAGVNQNNEQYGACGSNAPALVEGEPEGFQNVFLRDGLTGAYSLVNQTPEGAVPADATFQDASDDFSHLVFEDGAKLTADAPAGASLYAWVNGAVSLVTVLPDGTSTTGSFPESVNPLGNLRSGAPYTNSVSADGTRVIFNSEGRLYLREGVGQEQSAIGSSGACLESSKACTVQIDVSQAEGPGGGGSFLAADKDDTAIYFTADSEAKLTAGTLEGSGQHLYEYEIQTGDLHDLTPEGELGLQGLSGVSNDGAYLYIVASGALAGGVLSSPNLYLFHAGTVQLVATLANQDQFDWSPAFSTSRVTFDGRYLAFNSIEPLTGYDNHDAATGQADEEIYRYDAVTNGLICVSCMPSGARPSGGAAIVRAEPSSLSGAPNYLQRQLLDDGRVFFDTATPLVDAATNGKGNVYEYDGGSVSLVSSGTSDTSSYFYDASPTGEDVFFATTQHLVGGDKGNGMRLYDARVDGGFAEPQGPEPPCGGEGCRGPATEVSLPSLFATTTFGISGNIKSQSSAKRKVTTLTRKQKLNRALRECRHKKKQRRAACTRRARLRYGGRSVRASHRGGK